LTTKAKIHNTKQKTIKNRLGRTHLLSKGKQFLPLMRHLVFVLCIVHVCLTSYCVLCMFVCVRTVYCVCLFVLVLYIVYVFTIYSTRTNKHTQHTVRRQTNIHNTQYESKQTFTIHSTKTSLVLMTTFFCSHRRRLNTNSPHSHPFHQICIS
jgi:Ca2+/Na+ antiporter